MKKVKPWIALTILFYLLFLVWGIPARYVVALLEQRNFLPAAGLSITGVEGAWSDGRILELKIDKVTLSNIGWRFQPSGLLTGCLQFGLSGNLATGKVAGILRLGINQIELRQIAGQIPAAALGKIYLPGFELSGLVAARDLSLVVNDGYLTGGSGQLAWSEAKVSSPYQMSLGGVILTLATEKDGLLYKLSDQGGGLQANGLGLLTAQGNYSYDGTVGARQGSSPELATFLQIIGRPGADGMVKVKFKGQIPRLF